MVTRIEAKPAYLLFIETNLYTPKVLNNKYCTDMKGLIIKIKPAETDNI